MGTTGTGSFDDYPGGIQKPSGEKGKKQGREAEENPCEMEIVNISLEEIANCDFFNINKDVPPVNTVLFLSRILLNGRLAIETESKIVVGFLPTHFNYLLQCMEQGYKYSGQVISANAGDLPNVRINLSPIK